MSSWPVAPALALARRPDLWRTAGRVARHHAPRDWWRSKPHLPMPDRQWMEFRYETAFGEVDGRPDAAQFIEYLEWAKSWQYL